MQRFTDRLFYLAALVVGLVLMFLLNACTCARPAPERAAFAPVCAKFTELTIGRKGEERDVFVKSYSCELFLTQDGYRPGPVEEPAPAPAPVKQEAHQKPERHLEL
jgi:hypothetical protein